MFKISSKFSQFLVNHQTVIFVILITLQVLLICWAIDHKTTLFEDELWSFNLANSYFLPMLGDATDYYNIWLTGDFFNNALAVAPEHRFSFNSVLSNQAADTHPPLYYLYLHTVCSFFPSVWNKWLGTLPNIPFFCGTQILLYFLAKKFKIDNYDGAIFALSVCALYGFSIGAINTVDIVRMQTMMSFFTTAAILVNINIIERITKSEKINHLLVTLFFVYLAGILTQYFVVIPLFFASLITVITIYFYGGLKESIRYSLTAFISVFSMFLLFPAAINHLFLDGSMHSQAATNSLFSNDFMFHFKTFLIHLSSNIHVEPYLICSLLLGLVCILRKILSVTVIKSDDLICTLSMRLYHSKIISISLKREVIYWLLASITVFCSIALISQIVMYKDDRYIMHLFPIATLVTIAIPFCIAKTFRMNVMMFLFIFTIFIYRSFITINVDHIKWRSHEFENAIELIEQNKLPRNLIYVQTEETWWPAVEFSKFFTSPDRVMLSTTSTVLDINLFDNEYFLIVSKKANPKSVIEKIEKQHPSMSINNVFSSWWGDGFILTKGSTF